MTSVFDGIALLVLAGSVLWQSFVIRRLVREHHDLEQLVLAAVSRIAQVTK